MQRFITDPRTGDAVLCDECKVYHATEYVNVSPEKLQRRLCASCLTVYRGTSSVRVIDNVYGTLHLDAPMSVDMLVQKTGHRSSSIVYALGTLIAQGKAVKHGDTMYMRCAEATSQCEGCSVDVPPGDTLCDACNSISEPTDGCADLNG